MFAKREPARETSRRVEDRADRKGERPKAAHPHTNAYTNTWTSLRWKERARRGREERERYGGVPGVEKENRAKEGEADAFFAGM